MAWVFLVLAGLCEVGWAVGLKMTEGFTRLVPSLLTALAMIASLGLLGLALRSLPLGVGYGIWVGIGTVGAAVAGIALFGEAVSVVKLASLGLIIVGLIGLKIG
ncbi:QacE family quaternary ammonium compound efflux SMR transporter [Rhodospirillum rubrum]|uniref:SMR family transporter n=1 Tax=Rhodospirillum rubrum TaxID=1085 RepID=UPI001903C124|nr:SMR family transporter [Rhodospirillum rubrum]MBK1666054.1 QacE family quaternary ammonium compound efflux SMR transporter [Rhodospirillum rubrum]MBK1678169.1 QacE family quaternary ammonium compound efflux SMR transporter [Rhodospirillum rubrum]